MHSLGSLIALLGGLSLCSAAPTEQNITSDTYFYGDSPPFYPSRMFSHDLLICHSLLT